MDTLSNQQALVKRAQKVLPAGGFGNFDPGIVIQRGDGARVWDEDGKEYVDYLLGSGPMIVGHGHPRVTAAVKTQLERFSHTCFQVAPYDVYVKLAERLNKAIVIYNHAARRPQ